MWPMLRTIAEDRHLVFGAGEIWLARQDWVLLAAAAESDHRVVIWLAPVRLIMGVWPSVPPNGPGCRPAGSYLPLEGWLP